MSSRAKFLLTVVTSVTLIMAVVAIIVDRLQQRAFEHEVNHRARLVVSFRQACRNHVMQRMQHAVLQDMELADLEAVSSPVFIRDIFEHFNESVPGYTYKQAIPGSPDARSGPDDFEAGIIAAFKADSNLGEASGYRRIGQQEKFYVAQPIVVGRDCLMCHGDPNTVPPAIMEYYGRGHASNWKQGEVVGAAVVYTPTAELRAQMASMRWIVMGILAAITLILVGVDYFMFLRLTARTGELEQSRRQAEAASRAKSEFLANMSHEIRTPMTAILGFTNVLAENLKQPDQLEAANIIKRNGEHLLGVINDILDLSRIDAGKLEVTAVACSPAQIVAEVASLMRVRADAKGLSRKVEHEGPLPETIRTDPLRLRQILINLVGNAIKFTEVGSVRMVARLRRNEAEEPKLEVAVIDTGIGISREEAGQLFVPFAQADSSATRRFLGTGLGLAISQRLAEMLGGSIRVASRPGEGSTFSVTVGTGPLEGVRMLDHPGETVFASGQEDRQAASPQVRLDGRVLLAEDGPDNQRLLAFLLKRAGADVVLAENGQVAVDKALASLRRESPAGGGQPEPFDVVLMDMQMPVMDGYEATRRLRQAGYTGPIIALTAHAMSTDRQKCLAAGCDDYMTKPIVRDTLLEIVAKYVSGRPAPAEEHPSAVPRDN